MEWVKVIFRKNKSDTSKLIRFFTMGKWSHCGILVDDVVYEAVFEGVQKSSISDFEYNATEMVVKEYPVTSIKRVIDFLELQIGAEYDYHGAYGMHIQDYDFQHDDKWFCSELVAAALTIGGLNPFSVPPHRVTPQMIYALNVDFVKQILSHYEITQTKVKDEFSPRLLRIQKRKMVNEGSVKRKNRHIVYRDSVDKATIGYGRNVDDKGLSEQEALDMLLNDINDSMASCRRLFSNFDLLDDIRQEVLIDMVFNLGETGLSRFNNMRKSVEILDFKAAAEHMLDSLWARQVKGRATRLANMMITGVSDV